jgi:hypothetical protein
MKAKCICINDKNRPQEIPPQKWVKKDQEYNITHIYYHYQQKIQGCELAEIELTDENFPYQSFALNRFAFTKEGLEKLMQMIKDCTELNDIEVGYLVEELNLESV